jgi:hypothetical protein
VRLYAICSAATRKQISETDYLASSVAAHLRLVHEVLLPKKIPVVGRRRWGVGCRGAAGERQLVLATRNCDDTQRFAERTTTFL